MSQTFCFGSRPKDNPLAWQIYRVPDRPVFHTLILGRVAWTFSPPKDTSLTNDLPFLFRHFSRLAWHLPLGDLAQNNVFHSHHGSIFALSDYRAKHRPATHLDAEKR